MPTLRRRNTDPGSGGRAPLRSSLAHAAWAVEDRVVWGAADVFRGAVEVVKWPFERIAWAVEHWLVWPIQEETALWSRVSDYVSTGEASEIWREGCWEFATFPARYEGAQATVVFGIPLDPFIPTRTVAVVDESLGSVLLREEMRSRGR